MSTLTAEMAYEIGQFVFFRDALHNEVSQPTPHTIVERFAQECRGGVQELYKLARDSALYSEVALTDKEPPYVPLSEARIADIIRLADKRLAADQARWEQERLKEQARKDKKTDD